MLLLSCDESRRAREYFGPSHLRYAIEAASVPLLGLLTLVCIVKPTRNGGLPVACPIFCTSRLVSVAQRSLSSDSRRLGHGEVGSA
jgi:hypothetical protein